MDAKTSLLHTISMPVRGGARVDFRDDQLRAMLASVPKQAEFLSLRTGVDVWSTMSAPDRSRLSRAIWLSP